jgi:hypothetical protein
MRSKLGGWQKQQQWAIGAIYLQWQGKLSCGGLVFLFSLDFTIGVQTGSKETKWLAENIELEANVTEVHMRT